MFIKTHSSDFEIFFRLHIFSDPYQGFHKILQLYEDKYRRQTTLNSLNYEHRVYNLQFKENPLIDKCF